MSNDKKELLHDDKIQTVTGGLSDKFRFFGTKLKEKIKSINNKLYVEPNADPSNKNNEGK